MKLRNTQGVVLVCAVFLIGIQASAQTPEEHFGEFMEVRVTNIDVIATDSKGKPIRGLTREDFEILEDGKRQEITNFLAMTGAQPEEGGLESSAKSDDSPTSVSEASIGAEVRRFVFYVDNGTLSLKNRTEIFAAMKEFLSTRVRPRDEVMIVNWNGSLHVRLPWTSDANAIRATLDGLSRELSKSALTSAQKQRVIRLLRELERDRSGIITYQMVEAEAHAYAENVRHEIGQSTNAIAKLLAGLSGMDGKKILIMATETLPTRAGAEILEALENIRQRWAVEGARLATPIADISRFNVSTVIDALVRAANAADVTVYGINPRGTDTNDAGTADLVEPSETNVDFAASTQVLDGINMLASGTGGVAMIGAPAAFALAKIDGDLQSYYSIGYRARPGKSVDRKIEVKVARRGVRVRYRRSVFYRSLQVEMSDRVIANHLRKPESIANALGIVLQPAPAVAGREDRSQDMLVIIPVDRLTLLPDDQGNRIGGFSVFTSTGDGNARASGAHMQSQEIRWPAEQAAQMKGRMIAFVVRLPSARKPGQVSVGVVDQVSQTQGFATFRLASH